VDRTLREEIELYLADCRRRGLRPATLVAYRQAIEDLVATIADPGAPLEALTLAAGRAWQDRRTGAVSPHTIRSRTRALRTFSAWVAGEGDLPADPFARLRGPRVDRRVRVVPTDEELDQVLRGLDPERQRSALRPEQP
jgi:site-specific recombinase XerC